ncbi:MAG: hypothetical protein H6Q64_1722 [Firmicutes bacterium]|nr:hypothetical protein [Bacillota bacterium]
MVCRIGSAKVCLLNLIVCRNDTELKLPSHEPTWLFDTTNDENIIYVILSVSEGSTSDFQKEILHLRSE